MVAIAMAVASGVSGLVSAGTSIAAGQKSAAGARRAARGYEAAQGFYGDQQRDLYARQNQMYRTAADLESPFTQLQYQRSAFGNQFLPLLANEFYEVPQMGGRIDPRYTGVGGGVGGTPSFRFAGGQYGGGGAGGTWDAGAQEGSLAARAGALDEVAAGRRSAGNVVGLDGTERFKAGIDQREAIESGQRLPGLAPGAPGGSYSDLRVRQGLSPMEQQSLTEGLQLLRRNAAISGGAGGAFQLAAGRAVADVSARSAETRFSRLRQLAFGAPVGGSKLAGGFLNAGAQMQGGINETIRGQGQSMVNEGLSYQQGFNATAGSINAAGRSIASGITGAAGAYGMGVDMQQNPYWRYNDPFAPNPNIRFPTGAELQAQPGSGYRYPTIGQGWAR